MDYLGREGGGDHHRGLPGWAGRHGSGGLSCRELCARGRVCSRVVYVALFVFFLFFFSFLCLCVRAFFRFRFRFFFRIFFVEVSCFFLGGFEQSSTRLY